MFMAILGIKQYDTRRISVLACVASVWKWAQEAGYLSLGCLWSPGSRKLKVNISPGELTVWTWIKCDLKIKFAFALHFCDSSYNDGDKLLL